MAGILIYTAAGDSEGSMGGLVRMGEPENFANGFMDQDFGALLTVIISQFAIIGLGMVPEKYWRGIQAREKPTAAEQPEPVLIRSRWAGKWMKMSGRCGKGPGATRRSMEPATGSLDECDQLNQLLIEWLG